MNVTELTAAGLAVFDKKFLQTIITRVNANDEIFKKILDDEDFPRRAGTVLPAEGLRPGAGHLTLRRPGTPERVARSKLG